MKWYPRAPPRTIDTRRKTAKPGPCARDQWVLFVGVCRAPRALPAIADPGAPKRLASLAKLAVAIPVREIDDEADQHPHRQPVPIRSGQRKHQQKTAEDPENRHDRIERRAKWTVGIRI